MDDKNDKFLIADFTIDGSRRQVYLLNAGDFFEGFGGSSNGLLVHKTASLVVRETRLTGRSDIEHSINNKAAWQNIFDASYAARRFHKKEKT